MCVGINTRTHRNTFHLFNPSIFFSLCSLSAPSLPPLSFSQDLLLPAFALAVVGFGFTVSLGTMFALKHRYSISSNQVARQSPTATPYTPSTQGLRRLIRRVETRHLTIYSNQRKPQVR